MGKLLPDLAAEMWREAQAQATAIEHLGCDSGHAISRILIVTPICVF